MLHQTHSFKELPFSKLFKTYISDFSKLQDSYTYNPFSDADISKRVELLSHFNNNLNYAEKLISYHENLGINQEKQIAKLSQKDALTIVTGQQLGVYGGPLFTIYKTISAIILAKKWEKKLNKPVVPVFWLADEDHDFDEIKWFGIPGNNEFIVNKYDVEDENYPVSDIKIGSEIHQLKEELKQELFDTDFSDELWTLLNSFYKEGNTFRQAFAQLIDSLFSKYGVLIAGSYDRGIKDSMTDIFLDTVENFEGIYKSLKSDSNAIAEKFHAQVVVNQSNLFFIDNEGKRTKIIKAESGWQVNSKTWSTKELLNYIENNAERFSPNVFLRPILQDYLLPTIGYVAGPGELAYYGQMKDFYSHFGLEMPVIFPRLSVSLVESGIDRIFEKLPFEFHQYNERIEDLEKSYVKASEHIDIETLFIDWKNNVEEISTAPRQNISEIDGSLDGLIGKTISSFANDLDKLKGRVYRSIKQQEETQIQRIQKIKAQLFPGDGLQERQVSFVYFMNKYGIDIWDNLIDVLEKEEIDLQKHHIVKL